jgi:hypothetical protein
MAITGTVDLGNGVVAATVDTDPTTDNPGLPAGSLVIWSGNIYRQPSSGAPTVVLSLHASSHGNGQSDAVSLDAGQIGSGTLPLGRGGTGQTAKTAAFDGLAPGTTKGDLIVHNGTNNVRVGVGTTNQVLIADNGQAAGVKWGAAIASLGMQEVEMDGSLGATDTNASDVPTPIQNTSANYARVAQLTTAALTGTYLIFFSAEYGTTASNKETKIRLQNTTDTDTLAEGLMSTNSANGWYPFSGFVPVLFTGSAKTFQIQIASVTSASTTQVRRARMLLMAQS